MMATLSRHVPEPLLRHLGRLGPVPRPYCVVAFHRIAVGATELDFPPPAFADLCRYWRDHFEILTLDCLLARLAHGDAATGPALVLTFDDGYRDNAETAADILDRFDLNATFFIATGAVDTENVYAWDQELRPRPALMRWPQVRALHRAGFGIGSHTVSHARLSATRGDALVRELESSRARLEEELQAPILDFAYPFGGPADCDFTARAAVRAAGYRCCLGCHGGLVAAADSPFHLRRVAISPRWHTTPRAWARAWARWCWRGASAATAAHW